MCRRILCKFLAEFFVYVFFGTFIAPVCLCANSTFHNYSEVFRAGHWKKNEQSHFVIIDRLIFSLLGELKQQKMLQTLKNVAAWVFVCHRSTKTLASARYTNDRKNDYCFSVLEFASAGFYSVRGGKNGINYFALWSLNFVFVKGSLNS